ncbi:hypothetical protein [Pseudoalteromonas luteoviolacea]|uniref:Uncharacterized protein n=1 Tax=Pseudoalteromonas luteoviolacea NCIMB 1942 TaxID=1365253 RepID=A0A167C803_9GAMM|nr:hypothetical protein [Pseudoalteromonas luteoviolacea]KZN47346.1 hypothetical protein N482_10540 [Pseudoalteromonas luteoviolacea NCIMB 1942]
MKILNKQMIKFIFGGSADAPGLPDRSMANWQPNKAQKTPNSIKEGSN